MQGLERSDKAVFELAYSRRIPIAFSMAGGYSVPIEDTVQININTFRMAEQYFLQYAQNFAQP